MKSLIKTFVMPLILMITLVLSACTINSITEIKFDKTPESSYEYDNATHDVEAEIVISYSNAPDATYKLPENLAALKAIGVKVSGNQYKDKGSYTLKISYGSIVASYEYQVVDTSATLKYYVDDTSGAPTEGKTVGTYLTFSSVADAIAANEANGGNGIVYLQNITATISTSILIAKSVVIESLSAKQTIHSTANKEIFEIISTDINVSVKFKNVIFQGSTTEMKEEINEVEVVTTKTVTNRDSKAIQVGASRQFDELVIEKCEFNNFAIAINISAYGSNELARMVCNKLNITDSSFTKIFVKGLYVECADNIYINNNTFTECALASNGGNVVTPCVIDINMKFLAYQKVEISNNKFYKLGSLGVFKGVDATTYKFNYAAAITVKARSDQGNNDYTKYPASLQQAIIINNYFEDNFKNHTEANYLELANTNGKTVGTLGSEYWGQGISLIMIGEELKTADLSGILNYTISGNTYSYTDGIIPDVVTFVNVYSDQYGKDASIANNYFK